MRLTRFTDYALRVLIYLALRPGERATIREIADAYGISRNHLMKVVNLLTREGYIEAARGTKGGIRLGMPAQGINLGEVVRQTEEDVTLAECFGPGNQCVITPTCRLKIMLAQALKAFMDVLDGCHLSDLVSDADTTRRLLNIQPPARPAAPPT